MSLQGADVDFFAVAEAPLWIGSDKDGWSTYSSCDPRLTYGFSGPWDGIANWKFRF